MNGYSVNTYKFLSRDDDISYVRFHLKSNQGQSSIDPTKALVLAGLDSDYATRDLYNTICAKKELPSWTVCIQQMNEQEMKNAPFDPFDTTKVWPKTYYPLIALGTITLNRLPTNHFAEIEQLAFSPGNLVPGIELSPDKMLHARVFAYADAQRYRLGKNYAQLPVNRPLNPVANNHRDGFMCLNHQNGAPNYFPNSFHGASTSYRFKESIYSIEGNAARYECSNENDEFSQATTFYRQVLSPDERTNLARNLAKSLGLTQQFICKRALENFGNVDSDLASDIGHFLSLQRSTKTEDASIQTDHGKHDGGE
jgi:catalase